MLEVLHQGWPLGRGLIVFIKRNHGLCISLIGRVGLRQVVMIAVGQLLMRDLQRAHVELRRAFAVQAEHCHSTWDGVQHFELLG